MLGILVVGKEFEYRVIVTIVVYVVVVFVGVIIGTTL
jgi:hypothetical protein